jgi:predicted phosphodiesterase
MVSDAARMTPPWVAEPETPERIGLMADSHGDAALIASAAAVLRSRGCAMCVHLGDIVDTTCPETIDACLQALDSGRIKAVRGNNEHTLLLNRSSGLGRQAEDALRAMPFGRRIGSALLVHSLPFEDALGVRCLFENMDAVRLERFFAACPETQLFRGHSHRPEIVRLKDASLVRQSMPEGHPVQLAACQAVVITCGALTDGICLVWDRRLATVERVSLGRI